MFCFRSNRSNSFKSVIVSFVLMVCVLCLEVVFIQHAHEKILFPAAILVSTCILILGTMEIVFHGPIMRKLSNLSASYEGRFEAAPQLLLHVILLMTQDGDDVVDADQNVEQYFEYINRDTGEQRHFQYFSYLRSFNKCLISIAKHPSKPDDNAEVSSSCSADNNIPP